jgi:hypothetical protein
MTALLSIPIASYCSIKRLALIYFLYVQQDHKLNENGIRKETTQGESLFSIALQTYSGE